MKIAILASTPAQFHFYRNIIRGLEKGGNEVTLLVRKYGESESLIKELGYDAKIFSYKANSKCKKILSFPFDITRVHRYLRDFKPDLIVGSAVYSVYPAKTLGSASIVFMDGEPIINSSYSLETRITMPFVNVILTPNSFKYNFGEKHLKINSYKELSYLHPKYYKPREDIFDLLGISKGEDYVLLRFNAFDAIHDIGIEGFTKEHKIKLVKELGKYAHVFISAEGKVPKEIQNNVLRIPKSRIHDVLYYSKLLVADTGTMVTEAAVLGVPAIACHGYMWKMGNFIELEKKYRLVYNYMDPDKALKKAIKIIQEANIKRKWQKRRERLLEEKIDIASFMVWFLENYPESLEKFRQNPRIQYRFR